MSDDGDDPDIGPAPPPGGGASDGDDLGPAPPPDGGGGIGPAPPKAKKRKVCCARA